MMVSKCSLWLFLGDLVDKDGFDLICYGFDYDFDLSI